MKLRTKTWIVVLAALALMVVLMIAIGSRTVLRSFERLEHDDALRDADRVQALIVRQISEVERIARDYAEWVDTVNFARGKQPDYPEENWLGTSLENLNLNTMIVVGAEGSPAGSVQREPGTADTTAAEQALIDDFAADVAEVLADKAGRTRITGVKRAGGELWIAACVPLLLPDNPDEPLGALVVGRRIAADFVRELQNTAQLPLTLHYSGLHEEPDSSGLTFHESQRPGVAWAESGPNVLILHIAVLTKELEHAATIHVVLDRPIRREAINTIWLIVLQTAGIALVCGFLFHTLLGRAVVSRLERMHAAVKRVGQTDDLSLRVPQGGDDEIAGLGQALNSMLESMARGRGERETAHREREKLQDQLVQAQKMEALGDFAGGIAHDFNNCLTTITGWLSMVREDLPEGSENREHLGLALTSAAHASAVVKQLLVYSRQGEPTLHVVSLREVLGSSLQLLRAALPKSIQLNLSTTGDDDIVLADATQLKQVVLNLAKNAADAIEPPGRITLSLSAATLPSAGLPGAAELPAGRYAHLTVHDSGSGIKAEHLDRIFDPFFTTKPAGKGTGLGLAVVRSVVLRHRGGVGVTSPPGDGATFHVYLPLHQEPSTVAAADAAPPPAGCRVLVVDDDPGVLKVVSRLVSNLGYTAITATNGVEAWETFMQAEPPIDVVLTDLTMPKLGGIQLGERIFNSNRRVPVVLLSAYASTLDPDQLRRAGFAELLAKPIDFSSLKVALARARTASRG